MDDLCSPRPAFWISMTFFPISRMICWRQRSASTRSWHSVARYGRFCFGPLASSAAQRAHPVVAPNSRQTPAAADAPDGGTPAALISLVEQLRPWSGPGLATPRTPGGGGGVTCLCLEKSVEHRLGLLFISSLQFGRWPSQQLSCRGLRKALGVVAGRAASRTILPAVF